MIIWILLGLLVLVWMFFSYQANQLPKYSSLAFYVIMLAPVIFWFLPFINPFVLKITEMPIMATITSGVIFLLCWGWVETIKDASEEDNIKWFVLAFLIPPLSLVYWFVKD